MAQTKVTKPGIADDAVETTTIKNLNVTNAKIAAGTIDVTSKITGKVPAANLGTGTASATTILYGDQSYKAEPTTDLTPLRQDIITLALKQGVQENMTKHNLPSSAIVTFQADADFNLAGSTDILRNDDKYIQTGTSTTGEFTNDSDTLLLLHADGSDASTTITDSSSNAYTMSAVGNAQLDTAQKKFGTASILFDGTGDYVTNGSTDWDPRFAANDFTIEMWIRGTSLAGNNRMLICKGGQGYISTDYDGWSFVKKFCR